MAEQLSMEIDIPQLGNKVFCQSLAIFRANGVWEGPNPISPFIPLFFVQLTISMIATNLVAFAMRPFNQPPFVGELLAGILMGPSALGRIESYRNTLFPNSSLTVLEPMAHYFICFYVFLVGLRIDSSKCIHVGPKSRSVAIASTVLPVMVGGAIHLACNNARDPSLIFLGCALATTGIPVVKNIVENQHFFHSEAPKAVVEASYMHEMSAWVLLTIALVLHKMTSIVPFVFSFLYVVGVVTYFRPYLCSVIQRTSDARGYSAVYLCSMVVGFSLFGASSDILGAGPMVGCFLFGLVVPTEVIGVVLMEKMQDFVLTFMTPTYIVICGMRTNVDLIPGNLGWFKFVASVSLACLAKPLGAAFVFIHGAFPIKEAMVAGVLGNTKNITALIVIEIARLQQAVDEDEYSMAVFAFLLMTMLAPPLLTRLQPNKVVKKPYERRTIQKHKSGEELRILVCIQDFGDVPCIINLLHTSNATPNSPAYVYALEVLELSGQASSRRSRLAHISRTSRPDNPTQTDHIFTIFDNLQLQYDGVWTQTLSAKFHQATMGADVCDVAREKWAAFLILPFSLESEHKGTGLEDESFHEAVLAKAPCSVVIMVDKGFQGTSNRARNIALLYFGGKDDREALAYALRIIETNTPQDFCRITIVRFIASDNFLQQTDVAASDKSYPPLHNIMHHSVDVQAKLEKVLDDEFLSWFKAESEVSPAIDFHELVLNDVEETARAIQSMDTHGFDLFLVGRGRGLVPPLTKKLAEVCERPELGPIGDLLVKSLFESQCLVLVFQQYDDGTQNKMDSTRR